MGLFSKAKKDNAKYVASVDRVGVFDNTFDQAYPQTVVAQLVREHLAHENGKKKKVLIFGYDGARADSMLYLIPSTDQKLTGYNLHSPYSYVAQLKKEGGLYLSYAGGDRGRPETLQPTSTAQGWSSILTGKWGIEHGVVQHVAIRDGVPTVLLEAARQGLSASFTAIWPDHFTVTYTGEMAAAKREQVPLTFRQVDDEEQLQEAMLAEIDKGTDLIFGISEFPDHNGHGSGFGPDNYRYVVGVTNADRYAYELLAHIKSRPAYEKEDWLMIGTSDHGGHGRGHGTQRTEDRMTFLACNRKL